MKMEAKCNVCGKALVLLIDDDYAQQHDPLKLIGMATCNACYDQRQSKRQTEECIQRICRRLMTATNKDRQELIAQFQKPLESWLQKYTTLLCTIHRKRQVVLEETVLRSIIEHPDDWAAILSRWAYYLAVQLV